MNKLKVCLAGIGWIGCNHYFGYKQLPEKVEVSIVARSEASKTYLNTLLGLQWEVSKEYSSFEQALEDDELDLIDVTVPTHLHADFALQALRAGKHVLVETPACTTLEECREIRVELSKHPKLKSATGHICRHWPTYKEAKKLVDAGDLGKIFYTESDYAHGIDPEIYPPRPHKREAHVTGRLSISYHSVDLLRHIVGDVEEVASYISDDASLAMLHFKNGALGKVFSSGKVIRPYVMSLQVYGLKGTVICIQEEDELRGYWHKSDHWEPEMLSTSVNHSKGTSEWKMEMENVVDSILYDKQPLCTLEEGVSTVETCIAIDTAMTTGTRVKVRR